MPFIVVCNILIVVCTVLVGGYAVGKLENVYFFIYNRQNDSK